jgi:hypothetical protein
MDKNPGVSTVEKENQIRRLRRHRWRLLTLLDRCVDGGARREADEIGRAIRIIDDQLEADGEAV